MTRVGRRIHIAVLPTIFLWLYAKALLAHALGLVGAMQSGMAALSLLLLRWYRAQASATSCLVA